MDSPIFFSSQKGLKKPHLIFWKVKEVLTRCNNLLDSGIALKLTLIKCQLQTVLKKFYLVECDVFELRKFPPPNNIETSLLSVKKKCDEKNPRSRNAIFPLEFPQKKIGNSLSHLSKGAKKKF